MELKVNLYVVIGYWKSPGEDDPIIYSEFDLLAYNNSAVEGFLYNYCLEDYLNNNVEEPGERTPENYIEPNFAEVVYRYELETGFTEHGYGYDHFEKVLVALFKRDGKWGFADRGEVL